MARPSKYTSEFCQGLIEHMRKGLSFESYAGVIGVDRSTMYDWVARHPEFEEAKQLGTAASLLWWEKQGIEGMWAGKQFSATVWIANMKNRFGWLLDNGQQGEQVTPGFNVSPANGH